MKKDYTQEATRLLEATMARKGVNLTELHRRLQANGSTAGYKALSNKIRGGKFQFAFFLECMELLGVDSVNTQQLWMRDHH